MTPALGVRTVVLMKSGRITPNILIVALTAVFSLGAFHLVGLGDEALGSGGTSTLALIGNVAGLITCAASAWFGLGRLSSANACQG
jgi:hypothetical protein